MQYKRDIFYIKHIQTLLIMQNQRFSCVLNEYFNENIKLSFVSTRNVIIVTKNEDKVYEFNERFFSENKNLVVLLTKDESQRKLLIEGSIVEELCNKNIVDIKTSSLHKIVLTSNGQVYCWGRNTCGVLGNGMYDIHLSIVYKPQLNYFLCDKLVIDIKCGNEHTLVLTSNGQVYAWGGK